MLEKYPKKRISWSTFFNQTILSHNALDWIANFHEFPSKLQHFIIDLCCCVGFVSGGNIDVECIIVQSTLLTALLDLNVDFFPNNLLFPLHSSIDYHFVFLWFEFFKN